MNARRVLLLVVVVAAAAALGACGSSGSGGGASGDSGSGSRKQLSFSADYAPAPFVASVADDKWIATVKAKTKGAVTIKPTYNGVLYKAADTPAALAGGQLDLGALNAPAMTGVLPDFAITDMPFKGKPLNGAVELSDPSQPLYKALNAEAQAKGITLLPAAEMVTGTTAIFTTKKINSLADLKGMKIRSPGDVVYNAILSGLGTSPVALSPSDLVTALKTGTVDGALSSYQFANTAAKGLLKSAISLNIAGAGYVVGASKKSVDALSPSQQAVLGSSLATVSTAEDKHLEPGVKTDEEAFTNQGPGFNVHHLTPAEQARLDTIIAPLCSKFKSTVDPKVFSAWEETAKAKGMTPPC
ncbi:MAG TPA: TRAP transporter substrate-binding protein DctP [Solirubrobacteraceae bacterium]|nr:TRAP transporter substrate-binding protein DctP [Solirubrobacteraceae bacterium]